MISDSFTGKIIKGDDLEQHNIRRTQVWNDKLRKVRHPEEFPNGFACPACGGLLYDTGQIFPGPPPRMRVKCMTTTCNFRGEKIE